MKKRVLSIAIVLLLIIGGLLFTSCDPGGNSGLIPSAEEVEWLRLYIDLSRKASSYYETQMGAKVAEPTVPGISLETSGNKKTYTFTNFNLTLLQGNLPVHSQEPNLMIETLSGTYVFDDTSGDLIEECDVRITGGVIPSGTHISHGKIKVNTSEREILHAEIGDYTFDVNEVPDSVFPGK